MLIIIKRYKKVKKKNHNDYDESFNDDIKMENNAVDNHFPFKQICHIYKTLDRVYNSLLSNNGNCCKLQILETDKKPHQYYLYIRNYPIGYPGSHKIYGPYYDPSVCIEQLHMNIGQAFRNFKTNDYFTINDSKYFESQIIDDNDNGFLRIHQNNYNQTKIDNDIPSMYGGYGVGLSDEDYMSESTFNCVMKANKNNNFFYDKKKRNEFLHQKFKDRERKRELKRRMQDYYNI